MDPVWLQYRQDLDRLQQVAGRLMSIAQKDRPTRSEVDSIPRFLAEHNDAERAVHERMQLIRMQLRALRNSAAGQHHVVPPHGRDLQESVDRAGA
jgi:hypothetical protein